MTVPSAAGSSAATVPSEVVLDDVPSSPTGSSTQPTPTPSETSTMTPTPPPTAPATPDSSDPAVRIAIADLAERLAVATSDIDVISVEEVTWRDGSLGCPQPGMSYTQALIDGRRFVLNVGGVDYAYHSGRGGQPFYCPAARAQPPIVDPRT